MATERDQLIQAQVLLKAGKFDEARPILESLPGNPTARKWLAKIDEVGADLEDPFPKQQTIIVTPPTPVDNRQAQIDLGYVVGEFVKHNWTVTSQTDVQASLEKRPSSTVLAIAFGIVAILVLLNNVLYGVICIGGVLLLVALNNATQRKGTAYITATTSGVQVTSNFKRIQNTYGSGYRGKVKV